MTQILIHNVETGEILERPMNKTELETLEQNQETAAREAERLRLKSEAKKGLLEKLGITEEEAKLLFS